MWDRSHLIGHMMRVNQIQPLLGPKESSEKYLDVFQQLFVPTFLHELCLIAILD